MGIGVIDGKILALGGDIVDWKSRSNMVFIDEKKFGKRRNVINSKLRTVMIDGKKITRGTIIENWKPQRGSAIIDGNKITLVMIGTWPTPEEPVRRKSKAKNKRPVKKRIHR